MLKTRSGKDVSKIGMGTWTIKNEIKEVEIMKFYFDKGINYIDVVLAYDNGETIKVVSKFLKMINREDIFINAFITYGCNTINDIKKQIDFYLNELNTDYLDCVTLQGLDAIGFDLNEYSKEILNLKEENKFLKIGYSNISREQFDSLVDHMDLFEGLYNVENKINEDIGILGRCMELNIPFYAYQPLRRNRIAKQNHKEIVELASKYNKTQNQILINWMVKHKDIGVVIKSSNKEHIEENVSSLGFDMNNEDYLILDKFRNEKFDSLLVCYKSEEGKVRIDQVPNQEV